MKLKFFICSIAIGALTACGGGGSASAPVAESATGSNQLVSSLPSIKTFSALALQTPSATQAAAWSEPKTFLAKVQKTLLDQSVAFMNLVIPPAVAQSAPSGSSSSSSSSSTTSSAVTCNVKQLVGLKADGQADDLTLTSGTSDCVGVTDMFDGKKYILLATEGIYKDGKTCNIVFAQKSTGNLFCLGEDKRSRYSFTRKDSSNGWKKYEILQATENNKYIFLETKVDIFDDAGSKTGELIKLLRFDLSDEVNGPIAKTVMKGENTAWYNWGASGDTSYFTIFGYSGLENGDVAASYQLSINNNIFNSWIYNSDAAYFLYNAVADEFISKKVDLSSTTGAYAQWWNQISCFLSSDTDGFYFVVNSSTLAKGVYDPVSDAVTATTVGPTKLCSSWGPSIIQKVDGVYYGVAQNNTSQTWAWNPSTGQYGGSTAFDVFKRRISDSSDTVISTISISRSWANPTIAVAKDASRAFIAIGAYEEWTWNNSLGQSSRQQFGAEIFSVNLSGTPPVTASQVLQRTDKVWISAISNIGSDGIFQFSGRDMTKPFYDKIDVTIDANGVKNTVPASDSNSKQTLSVVRL